MAFHETHGHRWTLCGLLRAFFDLALAYFLLCISSFIFFTSKCSKFVGFYLPCPCEGILGYRNGDLCWQELFVKRPVRKIYAVQISVKSRFPFDLIWAEDPDKTNNKLIGESNCENGVLEMEVEACSSSYSSPRIQNLVDRESGFDAKGKRIMNLRHRSGFRRRRRANLEYGKFSSAAQSDSLRSAVGVSLSTAPYDANEIEDKRRQSLTPLSGREVGFQDNANALAGKYGGEKTSESFELSGSFGECKSMDEYSFSCDKHISNVQDESPNVGTDADAIRMLERALEEEKAACAALLLELEKERTAAATAADEAMAMISRLQEDKASIEIEARQYQRMIEEKFAYDEEELDVLKEILFRREKENHLLEKEIEVYRQMSSPDGQTENGWSDKLDEWKPMPLSLLDFNPDPLPVLPKSIDTKSNCKKMGSKADPPATYEAPLIEKQGDSNGCVLTEKIVISVGKEKEQEDNAMCQGMTSEASQECISNEKTIYCDGEELQQDGKHKDFLDSKLQGSMLDGIDDRYMSHSIDGEAEN